MSAGGPIRVLIVDDSSVVRRIITEVLTGDPDVEVAGTAGNGIVALSKLDQVAPDLVTLDVEMPDMNGLETLAELRRLRPTLPVIMFSTLTERGASATLDALALGASDYVTKPTHVGSREAAVREVRASLLPKIKALGGRRRPAGATRPASVRSSVPKAPPGRVDVVAVGVSTGGPNALAVLLGALPASLPVPMVIVQHMPPTFTRLLAERLDRDCRLRVAEARGGELLEPGTVLLAPGGRHLELRRTTRGVVTALSDAPPENSCRPSVDVLFRSVAQTYAARALGVVLTGMGQDGYQGARVLTTGGARMLIQNEATCVVWGMPRAISDAGLADLALPLPALAQEIEHRCGTSRHVRPTAVSAGVRS